MNQPQLFVKSIDLKSFNSGDERYIAGYANVADIIDAQNEVISLAVLQKAWDKWKSNPAYCILSLEHSNIPIAMVEFDEVIDSQGNIHKSGVDNIGLYLVAKLRRDINAANATWEAIKSGIERGFSIAGEHLIPPKIVCDQKECHSVPQDIELHEVGIVGSPANKASYFSVLKSDQQLFRLAELLETLDVKPIEGLVKVTTQPVDEGKHRIYVAPSFCRGQIVDALKKSVAWQNFNIVEEMCPKCEWVSLFDLSLSRHDPTVNLTTNDGHVGSNPSGVMDKPVVKKGEQMSYADTGETAKPMGVLSAPPSQVTPAPVAGETTAPTPVEQRTSPEIAVSALPKDPAVVGGVQDEAKHPLGLDGGQAPNSLDKLYALVAQMCDKLDKALGSGKVNGPVNIEPAPSQKNPPITIAVPERSIVDEPNSAVSIDGKARSDGDALTGMVGQWSEKGDKVAKSDAKEAAAEVKAAMPNASVTAVEIPPRPAATPVAVVSAPAAIAAVVPTPTTTTVVTAPTPPPVEVVKPTATEPVVVQRGKAAAESSAPPQDNVASLYKMPWRELHRLREGNVKHV